MLSFFCFKIDGVSDGSFNSVQALEIQCIRRGFLEFKKEMFGEASVACDNCAGKHVKGCLFCTPPITFVLCSTRNNIKMVPANREGNVFSGTCIDKLIMDMPSLQISETQNNNEELSLRRNLIFEESDGNGYDFVLVAHGGRKGTSKPVHYKIISNENGVWKPNKPNTSCLTKEVLQLMTYHMSFQYSTASKVCFIFHYLIFLHLSELYH